MQADKSGMVTVQRLKDIHNVSNISVVRGGSMDGGEPAELWYGQGGYIVPFLVATNIILGHSCSGRPLVQKPYVHAELPKFYPLIPSPLLLAFLTSAYDDNSFLPNSHPGV